MLKLKLKILSQAKLQSDQGFTIFEVLVAMIIALGFVATSLQAIVVATVFRVKAQEKELATQLIQEEIENIKWIANTLDQVPGTNPPEYNIVLSRCIADTYANGYAAALWAAYSGSTSYTAQPTKIIAGNNQVRLTRTTTSTNNPPNKTLKITYEVRNFDGVTLDTTGDPIATDYIEITPNAALQCP